MNDQEQNTGDGVAAKAAGPNEGSVPETGTACGASNVPNAREIKFRAWMHGGGMQYDWLRVKSFESSNLRTGEPFMTHNWGGTMGTALHVMQFTGILDKNGMEIYEGDILSKPGERLGVVVWRPEVMGYIMAQWLKKSGKSVLELGQVEAKNVEAMYFIGSTDKVIGNIYEHPHLLAQGIVVAEGSASSPTERSEPTNSPVAEGDAP